MGDVTAILDAARAAAARWSCAEVAELGQQVKALDPHAYDTQFWTTPELAPCVAVLEQAHGPRELPPARDDAPRDLVRAVLGVRRSSQTESFGYSTVDMLAVAVELGIAIPRMPLAVYALAAYGTAADYAYTAQYWLAGAGVELRACVVGGHICPFGAVELGYEHFAYPPDPMRVKYTDVHEGLRYGPRVGLEFRGGAWGVRLAAELQRYDHGMEPTYDQLGSIDAARGSSFGIGLAGVWGFMR
jgi:hypothetical protein